MDPFAGLSETNHQKIRKFLEFFRQKKTAVLRAIDHEINDIKSDRLNDDDVFNKEDVSDMLEFAQTSVKGQVGSDISNMINMSSLVICQLLEAAQEKGIELTLDTTIVENQGLLAEIEQMSLDSMPKTTAKRGVGELQSFKVEAKARREEAERLENNNRRLEQEVQGLKQRLSTVAESQSKQSNEVFTQVRSLQRTLDETKDELGKKVSDTTQFQQMRRIMQNQATQIRELRQKLSRYEPESIREEDD